MLKNMTFGQYYPGNSFLHRADPRIKLIVLIAFLVIVLAAKGICSVAVSVISVILLMLFSGVPIKSLLRSVRPLIFVLVFTGIINIFFTTGESEPLLAWKFIKIHEEGITAAVTMMIRLLSLVLGTSVLVSFTTEPLDLTDAIESLLSPLKKIKVPVHEFAMMMSIALRFIPTLIEETEKIMNAQKARCADFESGNIFKRIKALIPILIPLFVSAVRRAEELADAMECRCYRGGVGRTKLKVLNTRPADHIFLAVSVVTACFVWVLRDINIREVIDTCRAIF